MKLLTMLLLIRYHMTTGKLLVSYK